MKHISFSYLFLLLCLASCNKVSQDSLVLSRLGAFENRLETRSSFSSTTIESYRISKDSAAVFVRKHYPEKRLVSLDDVKKQGKEVLFVANFEDGWALISADTRADRILAYSEHGSFDPEDIPNPGARFWFEMIKNDIASLPDEVCCPSSDNENVTEKGMIPRWYWVKTRILDSLISRTYYDSGHYLQTTWGQMSPWNAGTPIYYNNSNLALEHCPTGCLATAMSQILYFLHYKLGKPNSLYHTVGFSNPYILGHNTSFYRSDYTGMSSRWDDMPLEKTGTNTNYVADLMIDVGDRVNMEYYPAGSGANTRMYAELALFSYGVLCDTASYSYYPVLTSLRNGMPVMVRADHEDGGGHVWVIDGIREFNDVYAYEDIWHLIYAIDPGLDILEFYSPEQMAVIDPDMYDGKTESGTYTSHSNSFILMNWGYDDNASVLSYNNVSYSPWNNASWLAPSGTYSNNKLIFYNFR